MKSFVLFITCCFLIVSCKNDSKKQSNIDQNTNNSKEIKVFKDKEVEKALYDGYFIKNTQGFDASIYNGSIYIFKLNPSEEEKSNHFFLHIMPKKGEVINMDFSPSEHLLNPDLSDNYANVLVYKREIPTNIKDFDINLGQFNNDGRTWATYIQINKLNKKENNYKNEYAQATKTNRYLKTFESAFDSGYFIKHQEGFDLLLDGHVLYYIKQNGSDADLKNMFFLHVKFDNKETTHNFDFKGEDYKINALLGEKYQKFIVIKREIIDQGMITEIGTGQFNSNARLWSFVYNIETLYDNMEFVYNGQYGTVLK